MKKFFIVLLFYCCVVYGQGYNLDEDTTFENNISLGWIDNYSSPYKDLPGSLYNDVITAFIKTYPGEKIEIQFGNKQFELDSLPKEKLIEVIYWLDEKWEESIRKEDERYYELYEAYVEVIETLKGIADIPKR